MKRFIFPILFLFICNSFLFAQKGVSQFGISAGYAHFGELHVGGGYNVGIDFKHYVHNRFFVVANFYAGVNDGTKHISYTNKNKQYNFDLQNSVRDYMIGFGLGADLLQKGRHKVYMQGTIGLGSSERSKDGIGVSLIGDYDVVKPHEEKSTRFAISAAAGYDFKVTNWLIIGVNYTLYQVGYDFANAYNGKLSLIF